MRYSATDRARRPIGPARAAVLALASLSATAWPALLHAQQLEADKAPQGKAAPLPYLAGHEVDYRLILGPQPVPASPRDRDDVRTVRQLQHVDRARWDEANLDARFVYPRFDTAFGRPVSRATSPAMIRLLNRTLRDVAATTFAAKAVYSRPRPFQRYQLARVCGEMRAPKPDPRPTGGSSYPSGHSAYGWASALILARLDPSRAASLFERAGDYAQSRLICGVHFPSDVEAGRLVAVAVVSRLDAEPMFQADLAQALAELAAAPDPARPDAQ